PVLSFAILYCLSALLLFLPAPVSACNSLPVLPVLLRNVPASSRKRHFLRQSAGSTVLRSYHVLSVLSTSICPSARETVRLLLSSFPMQHCFQPPPLFPSSGPGSAACLFPSPPGSAAYVRKIYYGL